MLTRLEIDGFKTFEDLAVEFAPFTAIVGTNAAGKSNLFDVIMLLSNLATRNVAEAIMEMRGEPWELFRQTPSGLTKQIRLAAEVLVDPIVRDQWGSEVELAHTRIRYEVTLERREVKPGIERIMVAHESAIPITREDDNWVKMIHCSSVFRNRYLRYWRQKPWLTTEQKPEGLAFSIYHDGKTGRSLPATAAEASVLYSITNAEFPHLFALREEMRQWRLLQLDPALLRKPAPATASTVLNADGSNLAAVLAHLKLETATETRPQGVLSDIAAELNNLISGVSKVDAELHHARREYRVELTMRDGIPFTSRVISDGTLRVLALLTLLHDPRHRGLICFEEPENGVHPARIKQLIGRLQEMVTSPEMTMDEDPAPLSQLILNSHSPVVLSALVDKELQPVEGAVLFADIATVTDPEKKEQRRKTRLRPVRYKKHPGLFTENGDSQPVVSDFEVKRILDTVQMEG